MWTRTDQQIRARCEQRLGAMIEGKYQLQELIGYGAAGAVYRAHNRWAGRACALKLFHYEGADEQSLLRRFVREAQAANRVLRDGRPHPNVVDALDVGRDRESGQFFIVQELLEGVTLAQFLQTQPDRRVTVEAALEIVLPILDAIGAAHAAGIIHRDLKPENIFLAREGEAVVPKVLDFGIAMLQDDRMTPTSEILGTPQYMAPEAFRGVGQVDGRADLWAVAVVLYEMLAGTSPFASPTGHPVDALRRILSVVPGSLASAGICPHPTWCVLRRAMMKDPERRTATAREFSDALVDAQAPVKILRVPRGASAPALRDALYRGDDADLLRGAVRSSLAPGAADEDGPEVTLADDPARTWWSVVFYGSHDDPGAIAAILALPELARRVELHLVGVPLGDAGLRTLLDQGALDGLTTLTLRRAGLTAEGAARLAASEQAGNLLKLDLEENPLGGDGARALASSAHLDELRVLSLVLTDLDADGAAALAEAPLLQRLLRLDLSQNRIGDAGASRLLASPRLVPGLWLGLARNRLSRELVAAAQRDLAARVRKLVM